MLFTCHSRRLEPSKAPTGRRGRALAGLAALAALAVPAAAGGEILYGPVLGRGTSPDSVVIRWGTAASAPTELLLRKAGETEWRPYASSDGEDHQVTVGGLQPSTSYEYLARSGPDEVGASFGTCPAPWEPLDLVFYGDSRNNTAVHRSIIEQILTAPTDLIVSTGDLTREGTRAEYLDEFFPIAGDLVDHVPYVVASGNHEDRTAFAEGLGSVMPLPADETGRVGTWYSVECGNSLFVVLDGNSPGDSAQSDFLDLVLARAREDANIQHVFAIVHQPPYSDGANHGDQLDVRDAFSARLEDPANKVTAVFSGDDHAYQRILGNGLTYIVTGGGGAPLYSASGSTDGELVRYEKQYHFLRLSITGGRVVAHVIDRAGAPIESFELSSEVPDPQPPAGGGDGGTGGDGGATPPGDGGATPPGDDGTPDPGTGGGDGGTGVPVDPPAAGGGEPSVSGGCGVGAAGGRALEGGLGTAGLLLGLTLAFRARRRSS